MVECESVNPPREFRLLPAGLKEAQRIAVMRYLAPQIGIAAAIIIISFFLALRKATLGTIVGFGIVTALLLVYMFFVSPLRVRRQQVKCWNSYVLTIGPDYLLRQQADTPDIRLSFTAVTRTEHLPGRYLRVIGSAKYQTIGIPESIENFEEIRKAVMEIVPETIRRKDSSQKNALLMGAGFTAYMIMLWSRSPQIVLPLAACVTALLVWLFIYMQRSPNFTRRSKRFSWAYLLFAGICVLRVADAVSKMRAR